MTRDLTRLRPLTPAQRAREVATLARENEKVRDQWFAAPRRLRKK